MADTEYITPSSDELGAVNRSPVELHLCKGNILVWNANDVKLLKETHHIVGALVGSLPRAPRQNAQLGLPLQLMPEEAAVLLEYDAARMVNVKVKTPSADDVTNFEQTRQRSFHEQQALWDAMSVKKKEDFEKIIALGRSTKKFRRAERAKKKKREKTASSGDGDSPQCTGAGVVLDEDGQNSKRRKMQDDSVTMETAEHNELLTAKLNSSQQIEALCDRHIDNPSRSLSCMDSGMPAVDDCERTSENDAATNNQIDEKSAKPHPLNGGQPEMKMLQETSSGVLNDRTVTEGEHQSTICCPPEVVTDPEPDRVIDRGKAKSSQSSTLDHKSDDADVFKKPLDPKPCTGYLVHIATASPATPKKEVTEWSYPTTQQEILKYRVFRDLWETGYYLTSGCKFGGDFLVYPGDPFLYHSYFIAICVPFNKPLSPLQLITYGRLGTNVKKTVILCSIDDKDEVVYTSLQWTGLS